MASQPQDTKLVATEPKNELDVVPTVSHGEPHDVMTAINIERQMSVRDSFRFWPKAIGFSFIISLAIIMEGYDTNLMSNFYAYPPFRNRFGNEVDSNGENIISAQWQTIISNGTQVRTFEI